ncbi:LacI family transcriptional regulator [Actinobacteria bacterium YIM 96077]|uniref:LacI family transcriptional regulator n=1 Tax=Phytoactinopolyspora halophila TaxID=1981511 RepID=A0A329QYE7_9ACTN|nr:LacI family DNA-binding transcriptional regulator [Phytoactinopolyspora halophila]AYY13331.1 LacI family transcriptional regulator [Actinobacteria bacterium YIM 96077]RAW17434.1 LacI family transcriptional regulator [Phytoactinopolyspora halophila]
MPRTTLRSVAQAAGVHAATASRALNPETRHLVNADTARRVLKAAERLGYQPNPIARSLKTARSNTIGLVVPDLTNPLFPPIARGIEEVLEEAGYSVWIVNTDHDLAREQALVESLRSRQVDGLILCTAHLSHPLIEKMRDEGVKMVLANRRTDDPGVPSVTPDDAHGIDLAVRHLAGLGHRRIAHLAGPQSTSTALTRARTFRHVVRDLGLDDDGLVVECAQWSERAGAEAMNALLDSGTSVTGVTAGNDLIALGCYDALDERGLSCPDDVSIVGFNNIPLLDKLHPPLTTVAIPHHELGSEAARMLLDYIEEPDRQPRSVLLPVSLITRRSTSAPPQENG